MRYLMLTLAASVGLAAVLAAGSAGAEPSQKADSTEPQAPVATEPAGSPAPSPVDKFEAVTREKSQADEAARASQERVEALDDETQKLLSEYRKAVADTESYQAYAAQLERQIESQAEELADIERQLEEIETTSRSITPLQQKMLATLKAFVELDVPFLLEERTKRVAALETMMDRADVSISEKYRRIVEAYQVEMDYGRTLESYEAHLPGDEGHRTAKFLRIGRLSLLYQTLDGAETGYWDAQQGKWVVDQHYAHAFKEGVGVAQKTSAPEMLLAPVPAPTAAKPTETQEARS